MVHHEEAVYLEVGDKLRKELNLTIGGNTVNRYAKKKVSELARLLMLATGYCQSLHAEDIFIH